MSHKKFHEKKENWLQFKYFWCMCKLSEPYRRPFFRTGTNIHCCESRKHFSASSLAIPLHVSHLHKLRSLLFLWKVARKSSQQVVILFRPPASHLTSLSMSWLMSFTRKPKSPQWYKSTRSSFPISSFKKFRGSSFIQLSTWAFEQAVSLP